MARVLVTQALPFAALDRLKAAHEVQMLTDLAPPPPELLRELAGPVEGLLCMLTNRIDTALLDAAPHLRIVSNYAVGTDNIDLAACAARGVKVGNTPDVLTDATADLAFALMLAAARDLVGQQAIVREGRWGHWAPAEGLGRDVHGATLVIVGAGRIGQAVAKRAAGFDMHVITVGRNDDLHAALREADFISLNVPLTEGTRHLIDAEALAQCRPTAILVNTARGPIIDQVALREALETGRLAAAGLDVTDPEPLPPDDALLQAPNLIVVPHIGSATYTARSRMADLAVDNLLAGLDGRPLPHEATA